MIIKQFIIVRNACTYKRRSHYDRASTHRALRTRTRRRSVSRLINNAFPPRRIVSRPLSSLHLLAARQCDRYIIGTIIVYRNNYYSRYLIVHFF